MKVLIFETAKQAVAARLTGTLKTKPGCALRDYYVFVHPGGGEADQ